ncbi:MAG: hypothetical protein JNJ57_11275, partial [Saprospiraceae bacterium]|nr:hypothetical protein [Saprospiraceae bacterium]
GGVASALALWWVYLAQAGLSAMYMSLTAGSTTTGQAVQHGLFDYWMITPELAIPSVLTMAFLYLRRKSPLSGLVWALWLLALIWSYTTVTWLRQEHTAPFAQSRFLFLLAAGWMLTHRYRERGSHWSRKSIISLLLLSVSWCASISWGYSLPLLFAAPWIWGVFEISDSIHWDERLKPLAVAYRIALVASLLVAFRVGYEFVYRDGKRSEMTEHLGDIFPKLQGIYSDLQTAAKYRDLANLAQQYGPNYAILPAFPQAHFLTGTTPPLPMDWVVNRESNGENELIIKGLNRTDWIFIEKSHLDQADKDPQLSVTQRVLTQCERKGETEYFVLLNRTQTIQ